MPYFSQKSCKSIFLKNKFAQLTFSLFKVCEYVSINRKNNIHNYFINCTEMTHI